MSGLFWAAVIVFVLLESAFLIGYALGQHDHDDTDRPEVTLRSVI